MRLSSQSQIQVVIIGTALLVFLSTIFIIDTPFRKIQQELIKHFDRDKKKKTNPARWDLTNHGDKDEIKHWRPGTWGSGPE
jgi:hypothetical protein